MLPLVQAAYAGSTLPAPGATRVVALDSGVAAVRAGFPATVWSALEGHVPTEPSTTVAGVFVGAGSAVYRLAGSNGEVLWRAATPGRAFAPTVERGQLFVGTEAGAVLALDPASGRVLWTTDLDGWVYPPAVAGNRVVIAGREPLLRALHAETGVILWEIPLPNEAVYQPVWHPNAGIVVTTFSGHVMAFDPQTGRARWSRREAVVQHTPSISGEVLVLRGFDGRVTGLAAKDGRVLWRHQSGSSAIQLFSGQRRVVLFGDGDKVTLLHAATGREVAAYAARGGRVERAWLEDDHLLALSWGGYAGQPRALRVQRWPIKPAKERLP